MIIRWQIQSRLNKVSFDKIYCAVVGIEESDKVRKQASETVDTIIEMRGIYQLSDQIRIWSRVSVSDEELLIKDIRIEKNHSRQVVCYSVERVIEKIKDEHKVGMT